MPRTRNITSAQWQAAQADITTTANTTPAILATTSTARRTTRTRVSKGDTENAPPPIAHEQQRRSTRLHSRTVASPKSNSKSKTASKAKSVGRTRGKVPVVVADLNRTILANKKFGKPTTIIEKRKKQPLQDITAQFVSESQSQEESRFKGQALKGLSQLTHTHGLDNSLNNTHLPSQEAPEIETQTDKDPLTPMQVKTVFPSSLPPSSPPPESTPFLLTRHDDEGIAHSSPHLGSSLPQAPSSPSHSGLRQDSYEEGPVLDHWDFDLDMEGDNENDNDENHAPTPTQMGSDPFGFLAVERRLKVERAERGVLLDLDMHQLEAGGRVLVASTSKQDIVSASVDKSKRNAPVMEEVSRRILFELDTPHDKKGKGRRVLRAGAGNNSELSSCTASTPSTPSPVKGPRESANMNMKKRAADPDSDLDAEDEKDGHGSPSPVGMVTKRRRTTSRKKDSGSPVDPVGLARSLGALLPKRRIRVEESEDEDSHVRKKKGVTKKSKKGKMANTKAKKTDAENEKDNDEEQTVRMFFYNFLR